MKISIAMVVSAALTRSSARAECAETMEMNIGSATKLAFSGFIPSVSRISNSNQGNKVVLKGYKLEPLIEDQGGVLTVSAGDPCDTSITPVDDGSDKPDSGGSGGGGDAAAVMSSKLALAGLAGTALLSLGAGLPGASVAAAAAVVGGSVFMPQASAQTAVECELAPIEVEIYTDATSDEIVMRSFQSGDFEVCPPESMYWKHHEDVYGGYEGCVGEKGLYPCPQDSQGIDEEDGELVAKYPLVWDGSSCVSTGYTTENRTYWILWGDPLDKFELNRRTGLNPVVSFPFNRGPYPSYEFGVNVDEAFDDSSTARSMAKDFLAFIGAFTADELQSFEVSMSEGAESGMVAIWGGKALEMAQTTCNRDFYVLSEVPAYSYNPPDSAAIANSFASSFYNGTECACSATGTCRDPSVTITVQAWLPLTPLPEAAGADGTMYAADSADANSPWFESMVWPENPTGKLKTPQIPDANRRVCDGVYVWPMYFGMVGYTIPISERPDCSAWSFSITKGYSASVRAGFILYKEDPVSSHDAITASISSLHTMTNGLYSEWSWHGQMQLWEMMMMKPVSDPTSWIGAYTEIMEEKWSVLIDAFEGCPVTQISNPRAGAYAWFQFQAPYLGIQEGFMASFFREVLGVSTTTYNFGFRGIAPESIVTYYGEGYTDADFTRLQLYRDVGVYREVARRAKIVCADLDATIGDFVSVNQWANMTAVAGGRRRKLSPEEGGYRDLDDRKRHLKELVPTLTEHQLEYVAANHEEADRIDRKVATCAPAYSMDCLFKTVGIRFKE